jgi:hypothetical protein
MSGEMVGSAEVSRKLTDWLRRWPEMHGDKSNKAGKAGKDNSGAKVCARRHSLPLSPSPNDPYLRRPSSLPASFLYNSPKTDLHLGDQAARRLSSVHFIGDHDPQPGGQAAYHLLFCSFIHNFIITDV